MGSQSQPEPPLYDPNYDVPPAYDIIELNIEVLILFSMYSVFEVAENLFVQFLSPIARHTMKFNTMKFDTHAT